MRRLRSLASRQYGMVASRQLGFTANADRDRVTASGRLHRVHRGVYAVGHLGLGQEARWLAAVLACGVGAVLSHRSAATFWCIRLGELFRVEVTTGTISAAWRRSRRTGQAGGGGPHHPPRHPGHQPGPHAGRPGARPGPRRADARAQGGDVPPPVRPDGDRGRTDPPPVEGAEGPAHRGVGDAVDDGGPLPDDLHSATGCHARTRSTASAPSATTSRGRSTRSSSRPTPGWRTAPRTPSRPTAARPTRCSSPAGWSCASPGPTSHDAAARQPPPSARRSPANPPSAPSDPRPRRPRRDRATAAWSPRPPRAARTRRRGTGIGSRRGS